MKKLLSLFIILSVTAVGYAQDFSKNIASARSSYAAGNLEEARFTMQQLLNDLDIAIGREVLKMLPAKMGALNANTASDNVTANTGLAGVLIHREYGSNDKRYNLEMMGNSPLIASINAILSIPFMGNSGDGTQKIIKVDGYKAMLQKSVDETTKKTDYTVQVPLGSTLVTFEAPDTTEDEVVRMVNTIPLSKIAKMVQ